MHSLPSSESIKYEVHIFSPYIENTSTDKVRVKLGFTISLFETYGGNNSKLNNII